MDCLLKQTTFFKLRNIWSEAVYENSTKTRLYKYNLFKISNIPYKLIFTTKFIDSSILIMIISCDYLNLSLANEYVGDVTIPTQVIKYNQNFHQADQPIRLQYSNQIELFIHIKLNHLFSPFFSESENKYSQRLTWACCIVLKWVEILT